MNAAPTALLVYGASYYPTEMLCIPMGLRIYRPVTGLVFASKLLTDININSHWYILRFSEGEEREIQNKSISQGFCFDFIHFE